MLACCARTCAGLARPTLPSRGYDRETMAEDLLALPDELGLDRVSTWWARLARLDRVCSQPAPSGADQALRGAQHRAAVVFHISPQLAGGPAFAYQIPLALPQLGRWGAEHGLARLALCTGPDTFSEREIDAFTDRLKGERARASELLYPTFLLREAVSVFAGRYARLPFGVPTRLLVGERSLLFRPEQAASADALELELVQGPGTSSWTRSQSS
jgi:hypothetical protein